MRRFVGLSRLVGREVDGAFLPYDVRRDDRLAGVRVSANLFGFFAEYQRRHRLGVRVFRRGVEHAPGRATKTAVILFAQLFDAEVRGTGRSDEGLRAEEAVEHGA